MSVNIHINSTNVTYTDAHITAKYPYQTTTVHREGNTITVRQTFPPLHRAQMHLCLMRCCFVLFLSWKQVTPCTSDMTFRTERKVPRLGVMLVGWGGNNGTTVTAAVLANKLGLTWRTKSGLKVSGMQSHL